jgi:hypothetical protein
MTEIEQREIHGLPVRIVNTRPDIQTGQVARRLAQALDLIAGYAPRSYRRLGTDLTGFIVGIFARLLSESRDAWWSSYRESGFVAKSPPSMATLPHAGGPH